MRCGITPDPDGPPVAAPEKKFDAVAAVAFTASVLLAAPVSALLSVVDRFAIVWAGLEPMAKLVIDFGSALVAAVSVIVVEVPSAIFSANDTVSPALGCVVMLRLKLPGLVAVPAV
ncbi:hypothetical protein ACU4GA_16160 [Methylobacterium oryzae CBMB20]